MRFSEKYNLNATQWELDFVDIPLNKDIELYVDPYAINIETDDFSNECNDLIVDYFDQLILSIKNKDKKTTSRLLSNLHEPNETHLGLSQTDPKNGRGIGGEKAKGILKAFTESKAAQTGFLTDLSDCVLLIPGIGRDNISDITTNIIKEKLIEYTQEQCKLYNIPTQKVNAGLLFDFTDYHWKSKYSELPVINGNRIILVPKIFVRYAPEVNEQKYYNNFVLEYLKAEHLKPGDSLVEVLKNNKLRVTKKKLKEIYPYSREYLYDFTKQHPEILVKYKATLRTKSTILNDQEIENKQDNAKKLNSLDLIKELQQINSGSNQATTYHNFITRALQAIFGNRIRRPVKEQEINEGRKRIDIFFENNNIKGFFKELNSVHRIKCPYILFECKNYSVDLKNPEFDQMNGRFSKKRGYFGIITCRENKNKQLMLSRCRDFANEEKYIILLDDNDIKNLLEFRQNNKEQEIDDYMSDKMKEILI
jgi:hypothetical protein